MDTTLYSCIFHLLTHVTNFPFVGYTIGMMKLRLLSMSLEFFRQFLFAESTNCISWSSELKISDRCGKFRHRIYTTYSLNMLRSNILEWLPSVTCANWRNCQYLLPCEANLLWNCQHPRQAYYKAIYRAKASIFVHLERVLKFTKSSMISNSLYSWIYDKTQACSLVSNAKATRLRIFSCSNKNISNVKYLIPFFFLWLTHSP